MNFKSKEEQIAALKGLPDEPTGRVDNVEEWQADIAKRRKEIEEATIGEAEGASPESPKEPTVPKEPPKEDVLNFNLKRDDLPEVLRGYKNPEEIVKQFAHAREYANKTEEKLLAIQEERETLKKQFEDTQNELKKIREEMSRKKPENPIEGLNTLISEFNTIGDEDFPNAKQVKTALKKAEEEILRTRQELETLKSDVVSFKNTAETTNKELELKRTEEAYNQSLKELQEKYPELKTQKPLYNSKDCVQNDIVKFTSRILGGLFNVSKPEWHNCVSVINAYLNGDEEIKKYCQDNAITPESIGANEDDIRKYVIINNVDHRVKGLRVKEDGTAENLINRFTLTPVSFANHVDAYESFKRETGIADRQIKDMIVEAEKRAALNLQNAMSTRAPANVLGSMGENAPDNTKEGMTDNQAKEIIATPFLEDKIEAQAQRGDRTLFDLRNKAFKHFGGDVIPPNPLWPPAKAK